MDERLSIDDFGTGYSSLVYLQRLPVVELKIDRSFVMSLSSAPDDAVIVRSIIDLAHNLGVKVVAEGVEDAAALAMLIDYGCDAAQGYFFSRPMTAAAAERWFESSAFGMPRVPIGEAPRGSGTSAPSRAAPAPRRREADDRPAPARDRERAVAGRGRGDHAARRSRRNGRLKPPSG